MIRLVIFDLDGTLVNAYPAVSQSVNYTLKAMGFKPRSDHQIKRAVGWGDRQLLAQFIGDDLAAQALRLYRPHHSKALVKPGGVKFLPGAHSTLKSLKKQGYKLAIATNRPTIFTRIILKRLGIWELLDMTLCADKVAQGKPQPDILHAILKKLKVTKLETLYVGDMTIDVNTGHNAGIRTIAVTTGSSTKAELKTLQPWRIISKIDQLKTIIGGHNE
jgi:phosphoglycolate phosphatase